MKPARGRADLIRPPECAATAGECVAAPRSGSLLHQPELGQRRHAVVEADLLDDLAVDHFQHRGAGEVHLAAGRSRESSHQEVVEGRTRMGATAFPPTDDVVALGDQVRRTPEIEVGESGAEIAYERFDVVATAA